MTEVYPSSIDDRGGRVIIDPEWQRKYVWDRRQASKLIESIFIDLPMPVIYLVQCNIEL